MSSVTIFMCTSNLQLGISSFYKSGCYTDPLAAQVWLTVTQLHVENCMVILSSVVATHYIWPVIYLH